MGQAHFAPPALESEVLAADRPALYAALSELAEQAETLRGLGCDLGQGFHFARPMDAEATMAFVARDERAPVDAP